MTWIVIGGWQKEGHPPVVRYFGTGKQGKQWASSKTSAKKFSTEAEAMEVAEKHKDFGAQVVGTENAR